MRIARVDDDVTLIEERHERVNNRVRRPTCLHHDDDLARRLERCNEVLERLAADEVSLVSVVRDERVHLLR